MMEEEPEWNANGDMVGSGGEEDEQRDVADNYEDIADAGNRGAGEDIAPMSTLHMLPMTRGLRDFSKVDLFFLFIQCFIEGYSCTEVIPFISNVS